MLALNNSVTKESKQRKRYYLRKNNIYTYLTEAELRCLRYLLEGKSYQETAALLQLSVRTIEFYSQNMQAKLICHNRDALIQFFKNYLNENPLSWL